MKRLALLLLLVVPAFAHAVDIEIAAGAAHYQPRGNGMWYQEGMPHSFSLNAPAVQVGVVGAVMPHLDWRVSYVWLGQVRSDAIATTDENYGTPQNPCRGQCVSKGRFVGHGYVQGVKFSLEPYTHYAGWRFGVEVGAFVFRPFWQVDYTERLAVNNYADSGTHTWKNTAAWQVSPMAGVSVGRGSVSLSYQFFMTSARGDGQFSLYGATHVVQLRYRF